MTREKIITTLFAPFMGYVRHYVEHNTSLHLKYSAWGGEVNVRNHLLFGGCDGVELAEEYGTPLHVVDRKRLQRNHQELQEGFVSHDIPCEIYYSYKTNPVPGILKELHANGAGAEIISPYELWLALKLGVKPDTIIYNGPNKSVRSLRIAIENKIKLLNINSWHEIRQIIHLAQELQIQVNVGIRVSLRVGWGENQFGFSIASGQAREVFETIKRSEELQIKGIHCHLETNIRNPLMYEKAIEEICRFMYELKDKSGIDISYLDLGGGFGILTVRPLGKIEFNFNRLFQIPYRAPNVQDISLRRLTGQIAKKLRRECGKYDLDVPGLICEPGRALTGNAQILLTRVGDIKKTKTGKIAMLDAGINIASPVCWEYHEIFVANKMNAAYDERYDIVGPICTPNDVLYKGKTLPRLEVGDIVAIMDAGAYFISFSTNFSFPRPAVVMVSDGKHWVLREKEGYEDMTRLDHV